MLGKIVGCLSFGLAFCLAIGLLIKEKTAKSAVNNSERTRSIVEESRT